MSQTTPAFSKTRFLGSALIVPLFAASSASMVGLIMPYFNGLSLEAAAPWTVLAAAGGLVNSSIALHFVLKARYPNS